MKNKKILFIAASHGDEPIGLDVIKKIEKTKISKNFDYIVGNPEALKKGKRFTESDLNRVYPGKNKGDYEEKRAKEVLRIAKKYPIVIDLHGTISKTGIFIIITRLNKENISLALKFNIRKIVIWPDSKEANGSLSTFVKSGLEIESGEKTSIRTRNELRKILVTFLENKEKKVVMEEEMRKKEFFTVIGKIKNKDSGKKKFEDWKKIGNFYPLFVGQYSEVACYKLKKLSNNDVLKII